MPHKMTKKDTKDVEATGEDSKGRTNNFKSHKNVRERRQKLGSRSSSHSMSTTKIMGGKNKKKNKEKKEKEAKSGGGKPLVSEAEVTPTESSGEEESESDDDESTEPSSPKKSSPTPGRRKREPMESSNEPSISSFIHMNSNYSYCDVASIGTKYESLECKRDCYAKF